MFQATIASIDTPKNWRTVKVSRVRQLADSIATQGLLQPIGITPNPEAPDRFLLVFGKGRLEACRLLNHETIDAKVLAVNPEEHEAATAAENIFRSELTAGERVIALSTWQAFYQKAHPASSDRIAKAAVTRKVSAAIGRGQTPEPVPPSFSEHAAETTGVPARTIRRYAGAAQNLSEEHLGILAERGVPLKDIEQINKAAPEVQQRAVSLIASGMASREAIAKATTPANATVEQVEDPTEEGKTEEELSDDEWLETYCGEVLARLKYQAVYRKAALLYRHIREAVAMFRGKTKKALAQSKTQLYDPYHRVVAAVVNVDHPKHWTPCGPCGGAGMSGNKSKCGFCHGHAFSLSNAGGRR